MIHDPLCPLTSCSGLLCSGSHGCQCVLIAKVREDERINVLGTRVRELKPYADGYADGQRDALNRCIAAVEVVPHGGGGSYYPLFRDRVLIALRALEEKP